MPGPIESDAVVVGAGIAGSAAAFCLARAGIRVALIEAGALEDAGARWSDDTPPWTFDRAGIARPEPDERRNLDVPYVLTGTAGGRVELPASPMWAVDVRRLTARLQQGARQHGATCREHTAVKDVRCSRDGRPIALLARANHGRLPVTVEFRARLFVDATGLEGAVRCRVPSLAVGCPPVAVRDLCSAAQYVCEIGDRAGAASFLEGLGVTPGTFVAWAGVAGGFSTRVVHVDAGLDAVAVLTGTGWDGCTPGARQMMDDVRRELPWIGSPIFGGQGLIPLRRPYDRLAAPGIALIGDAACQVFPATGCGVGPALMAAGLLADAVAGREDPGSEAATWAYQAAFQRERGGVHAAYDLSRRLIQSLSGREAARLVRYGLMTPGTLRSALDQRMPEPAVSDLARMAGGAIRGPLLAARMGAVVPRMFALRAAYATHPPEPDAGGLAAWSRRISRLAGTAPDAR